MGRPSKQLMEFMALYQIDSDEVWEVRTGGAWAIKHSALERVAAEKNISFELPTMIETDSRNKVVSLVVMGRMGDRAEWSIGEAAPSNYRTTEKMSAYPYAMAEKRAKDRVILKLLNSHGTLYSEEEADDFAKRQNPHVTKPEDIGPAIDYDDQGNPIDNIPHGDGAVERMTKANAKPDFAQAQFELRQIKTAEALQKWGAANANRIATYPLDWAEILRGLYAEHLAELRKRKVAA